MANECFNEITLTGKEEIIVDFINLLKDEEAEKAYGELCVDFRNIIPIPENISDISSFCKENYGATRYGGFDRAIFGDTISFYTHWEPCVEFIINASKLFDLDFYLIYEEPGMDFCGVLEVINGEVTRQEEDSCESELAIELFGDDYFE